MFHQTPSIDVSTGFDCYGFQFSLNGDCATAIENLADDFAFFATRSPAAASVRLLLSQSPPDYDAVPACPARSYTPRNVVYVEHGIRWLDFGGRGLARWDSNQKLFCMSSTDPDLVYEAAYLFLLSQVGKFLDGRGLHRLHAVAMSWKNRAVLIALPMGGGKSTLAMELLKHDGMQILSDDSPIIGRRGQVLAFPLRLGVLPGQESALPVEHRRLISRMEFGPKYVLSYASFAARVTASAEPGLLLIGHRTMAHTGWVAPASYRRAMQAMVPHLIIGLGLFQGLEYLVNHSIAELVAQAGVGFSRLRTAHQLVRKSHCFNLYLGRDLAGNAQLILDLARRHLNGS